MDKSIEQIFKVFNHIARELQVYFIPGFTILLNIYIIDYFYYNNSLIDIYNNKYIVFIIIVVAYVFGHICMALYYVLIEHFNVDKTINKLLGFSYKVNSDILPILYNHNREAYFHFVERYIILYMMRWTMSAAFFIIALTDVIFLIYKSIVWQVVTTTVISAISSVFLFILTSKTENDYAKRIETMFKIYQSQVVLPNNNKLNEPDNG